MANRIPNPKVDEAARKWGARLTPQQRQTARRLARQISAQGFTASQRTFEDFASIGLSNYDMEAFLKISQLPEAKYQDVRNKTIRMLDIMASSKQSNPPSCGTGKIRRKAYTRKSYTRADGTRVGKTRVPSSCITDRGAPGRGKKVLPTMQAGGLGGPGYTTKSKAERHKILRKCVEDDGYRTCMGRLMEPARLGKITMGKHALKVFDEDRKWLVKTFGGAGSFGPRRNNGGRVTQLKRSLSK